MHAGRADAVGAAFGVRRDLRRGGGRGRVRGRGLPRGAGRPRAGRPRRQVRGAAGRATRRRYRRSARCASARTGTGCSTRCASSVPSSSRRPASSERFLDRLTARCLALATELRRSSRAGQAIRRAGSARLRAEHENITRRARPRARRRERRPAAWPPAADASRGGGSARTSPCGCPAYWQISGQLDEGRQWLGRVCRLFPEPAPERAWALGARGQLATFQGDLASALADISESIRLAAATDAARNPPPPAATCYLTLALGLRRPARARRWRPARRRRAAGRPAATGPGWSCLQPQLAHLHQLTGNVDEAIECCERGLADARRDVRPTRPAHGAVDQRVPAPDLRARARPASRPGELAAAGAAPGAAAEHELGDVARDGVRARGARPGSPRGASSPSAPRGCSARRTSCGRAPGGG